MATRPSRRKSTSATTKRTAGKRAKKPVRKRPQQQGGGRRFTRWLKAHLGALLVSFALLFFLAVTLCALGYVVFLQG